MPIENEVKAATASENGGVSPFGLPHPMRTRADQSNFAHAEISLGSGARGIAVIMASEDLKRALGDVPVESFADRNAS